MAHLGLRCGNRYIPYEAPTFSKTACKKCVDKEEKAQLKTDKDALTEENARLKREVRALIKTMNSQGDVIRDLETKLNTEYNANA